MLSNKKIIAYARQSLKKTDKASSTVGQLEGIKQYCKVQRLSVDMELSDTASGKNLKRKQMQRLLSLIQSNAVDKVIVWRMDRIARNTKDLLHFLELCSQHQVSLESLNDEVLGYQNASDKFKVQTLAIMAELQRNIISENIQNSLKSKFQKGYVITTFAPFGYRYENKQFVIHEKEAKTVGYVFEMYVSGNGYKKISQSLQAHPTLIRRNPAQVRYIILNPKYTGDYVGKYGIIRDALPPIISKEMFETAKKLRESKQRERKHTVNANLRHKIICPLCGKKLSTYHYHKQPNATPFYVCPSKLSGQYHDCAMKRIPIKSLEHQVMQYLKTFLTYGDALNQIHTKVNHQLKEVYAQQQNSLKDNQKKKDELVTALAEGYIDISEFKAQVHELESDKKTLKQTAALNVTLEQVSGLIQHRSDVDMALWQLVETVEVNTDGDIINIYLKGWEHSICKPIEEDSTNDK
ncbi:recombinase family protein [Corticicoccus populi]|uniref:Recombinase family protein n=1 Tax=Corticicoccus populi TaxID=1812821 RepID=A0ABW5X0H2_9STAP